MTALRLIFRSLRYYWRTDLCAAAALAVATAVIVGSLLVGSSMHQSLLHQALLRVGNIDDLLVAPRFFRAAMAQQIQEHSDLAGKIRCAAIIVLPGSAGAADQEQTSPATVVGADEDFWKEFPGNAPKSPVGQAVINRALAEELGIKSGDEMAVNVDVGASLPDQMLFAHRRRQDTIHTLRLKVAAVMEASGGGDFAVSPSGGQPRNVFIDREFLASAISRSQLANVMAAQWLAAPPAEEVEVLGAAMAPLCQLDDYGLSLSTDDQGTFVAVESSAVLLDPALVSAIRNSADDLGVRASSCSVYLASQITCKEKSIAYVIFGGANDLPEFSMRQGEPAGRAANTVMLNSWAADDLDAHVGDAVKITYLVPDPDGTYQPASIELHVSGIAEMSGLAADRHLVPDLNGLTDARRIDEWKTPFPVDHSRITPRDEQYWDRYGPALKAFVAPQTIRTVWNKATSSAMNRFLTTVLLFPTSGTPADLAKALPAKLLTHLSPPVGQLVFQPLRQRAVESARGSVDFGQLLASMSAFLAISAAAMAAALLRLHLQQRATEVGMLLAVGCSAAKVRAIAVAEGAIIVAAGAVAGMPIGIAYNWAMVQALNHFWTGPWQGQLVAGTMSGLAMLWGLVAGLTMGLICLAWASRAMRRASILRLLAGRVASAAAISSGHGALRVAEISASLGVLVVAGAGMGWLAMEPAFFAGGALLLVAALAGIKWALSRLSRSPRPVLTLGRLALRNAAANSPRSLLVIALLASATFTIVSVAANRRDAGAIDVSDKRSGAGGFDLRVNLAMPVHFDLSTAAGRDSAGFSPDDQAALSGAGIVSLLSSGGDDTSCLNLAQPTQPRLLGVTSDLVQRRAFTVELAGKSESDNAWEILDKGSGADQIIPAFGDADSVQWILHSGLGQVSTVRGPGGNDVKLRIDGILHNSIFAGELLVAEQEYRNLGGRGGYSVLLVRSPSGRQAAVKAALQHALADYGVRVVPTSEMLARYQGVQNVYLSILLTLGGLGLLLGVLGMLAVIFRNVLERRSEMAIMSATGFERPRLVLLVAMENVALLAAGLACGVVPALLAVAPALRSRQTQVQWTALAAILLAVAVFGVLCCVAGTNLAIERRPLAALREE